jgi:hypothetical protein
VVERFPLAVELARDVVRALREALPGAGFALETRPASVTSRPTVPRYDVNAEPRVDEIEVLLDGPVIKLLVRHESRASTTCWPPPVRSSATSRR